MRLISEGLTFDDLRDQAITICYGVCDGMGYNGTIMCPGIIDNYGPHVSVDVMESTMLASNVNLTSH